jgi:hypothetical protein
MLAGGQTPSKQCGSRPYSRCVNPITLLSGGPIILGSMLFLSAFSRLSRTRDSEQNDLLAESHAALGHLGLTVIALVFVLLTFWKS